MTSITEHSLWNRLRDYVLIQYVKGNGVDAAGKARFRLEIASLPSDLAYHAKHLTIDCPACGSAIHPIRFRTASDAYFAATCPLNVRVGCSRGGAPTLEYERIRDLVEAYRKEHPRPLTAVDVQEVLFK